MSYNAKIQWIAEQTGEYEDDVFDVLKGNISQPCEMVDNIMAAESEYDSIIEAHTSKG